MLYVALLLATLKRALRARRDLLIENLALRQQLVVYRARRGVPSCAMPTDGSGLCSLARGQSGGRRSSSCSRTRLCAGIAPRGGCPTRKRRPGPELTVRAPN